MFAVMVLLLLAVGTQKTGAFSMIGAFNTTWMTANLSHDPTIDAQIGGPMNLGEEYRWSIPTLFYAVDRTFLDYFGQRGSEEIDKAMKIINDLPPVSQINIDSFPVKSERINFRAQALGMFDLKSFALATMVEELGLGAPSRFVFTLRKRLTPPGATNYFVIKRNFDPVTLQPSSYINGDLWTYNTIIERYTIGPDSSIVFNSRVDPLAYGGTVADLLEGFAGILTGSFVGSYYTGLTRDDVGGLKYVYHPMNRNVENAPTNAFSGGGFFAPTTGTGLPGTGAGFPWGPVLTSSNVAGGGAASGIPWAPIFVQTANTNAAGGGGAVPGATNNFINTALRGGIDRIRMVKVNFDSLLGQFLAPVLDTYQDTIVTNSAQFGQVLQRIVSNPDVLFAAGDFSGPDAAGTPTILLRTANFVSNVALNQQGFVPGGIANSGPGIIDGPVVIAFSTLGPTFFNSWPFFLDEAGSIVLPVWGSFDGTTNAPVAYPNNVTIEDLERRVLGGP